MATATALQFSIDTKASRFTVQAFATGFASVIAHDPKFAIRDFTGEVSLDPDNIGTYLVKVAVHLRSLELIDEVSAYDRSEINRVMFDEVLEVGKFEDATLLANGEGVDEISENIYRVNLSGKLSLHGNTRPINFTLQAVTAGESIKASGELALVPSEFGIRLPAVARSVIKMKDQVKLAFFMVGRKS